MSNMRFLYNSFFDEASLALAVGAVDSDWPLANTQNTLRRKVTKTVTDGNITINIDLGSSRFISGVSLVEHNLNAQTEITITGYSDAYTTAVITETFEAIGPIIGLGEKRLGEYYLGGYPNAEDLALLPKISTSCWFTPTMARYWSVQIANGATSADVFYLGRIILGDYWEVEFNPSWGLKYGLVDPSITSDRSLGGVDFPDEKERYYRAEFTLPAITDGEIFGHFIRLCEYCGVRKSFILQIDDENNKRQRFTTIYGKLLSNPLPELKKTDFNGASFQIEESL